MYGDMLASVLVKATDLNWSGHYDFGYEKVH